MVLPPWLHALGGPSVAANHPRRAVLDTTPEILRNHPEPTGPTFLATGIAKKLIPSAQVVGEGWGRHDEGSLSCVSRRGQSLRFGAFFKTM